MFMMAASPYILYTFAFMRIRSASALPTCSMAFDRLRALTLGDRLHSVAFRLGRQLYGRGQFALLSIDFLRFDLDLLAALYDIDLNFLVTNALTNLGCLQFVRELRFSFLWKRFAFCSLYMRALSSIFVSVEYFTSIALFSHSASRMPASRFASATPASASRLTLAVCALPSDCRYWTSSYTSLIVKDNISMPILPTSGAATSRTSAANWSRSLYTSSTTRTTDELGKITRLEATTHFPKLTENGSQVTFERLQDCHLDLLHRFAQKLFTRRTKQLVGLMVKIIDVHHL
uniref:Uncharacterized protein n=1 Tax=Anopheles culicifacies TaxID=139723 RepID=A0A182M4C7_9DIPT